MENEIDTHLFVEIILSEGASCLSTYICEDYGNKITIQYFTGPSGKRVSIYTSEEFISKRTIEKILLELGYADLIDRLFI